MMGALRLVNPSNPAPHVDPFAAIRRRARHDSSLSIQAYRLLEDVCDLARSEGVCKAKQSHFAGVYDVDPRTVKRWVKELVEAGYVAVVPAESDGRRKLLKPSEPAVRPAAERQEIGDTQRHPNRGQVAQKGDAPCPPSDEIGDTERQEIGDTQRRTPRDISPPRGERGARAREGSAKPGLVLVEGGGAGLVREDDPPAVAVYVSRCGRRPSSTQAYEIERIVGEDPGRLRAWIVVCETWAATHEPGSGKEPYNLAAHRRMLANLEEDLEQRRGSNLGALPEAKRAAEVREQREHEPRKPADPALIRRLAEETFGERYGQITVPEPPKRRRDSIDVDAVEEAIAALSEGDRAAIEAEAERRGREVLGEVFDVANPSVASALLRLRREVYVERYQAAGEEVAR